MEIYLPEFTITDSDFESIPKTKTLLLNMCEDFTDGAFKYLIGRVDLIKLDVSHTNITNLALVSIVQIESLEILLLDACDIDDEGVLLLEDSALKELSVSYCTKVTNVGMRSMARIASLRNLNISGCFNVDGDGLEELISLNHLERLDISMTKIDNQSLLFLNRMECVKHLTLNINSYLTDVGLKNIILPLQSFSCRSSYIGEEGLSYLSQNHSIRELYLSSNNNINDAALCMLKNMSDLVVLDLSNCNNIYGGGLQHFSTLTNLEILKVGNRINEGIEYMTLLTSLKELNLGKSPVSSEDMSYLSIRLTNTKIS